MSEGTVQKDRSRTVMGLGCIVGVEPVATDERTALNEGILFWGRGPELF